METKDFYIFGTKYTLGHVEEIDDKSSKGTVVGLCDSTNYKVWVATKLPNGESVPKDDQEKNKLHELFHAVLNEGGYLSLSDDEPLVEWLARCTQQLLKQGII